MTIKSTTSKKCEKFRTENSIFHYKSCIVLSTTEGNNNFSFTRSCRSKTGFVAIIYKTRLVPNCLQAVAKLSLITNSTYITNWSS